MDMVAHFRKKLEQEVLLRVYSSPVSPKGDIIWGTASYPKYFNDDIAIVSKGVCKGYVTPIARSGHPADGDFILHGEIFGPEENVSFLDAYLAIERQVLCKENIEAARNDFLTRNYYKEDLDDLVYNLVDESDLDIEIVWGNEKTTQLQSLLRHAAQYGFYWGPQTTAQVRKDGKLFFGGFKTRSPGQLFSLIVMAILEGE